MVSTKISTWYRLEGGSMLTRGYWIGKQTSMVIDF
jgi:hypothetical protein